uniref:ABC transporter C family member 3 n=1 Tax=Aegilops tauschii TaxID=37682 RepID=M8AUT6_AEGTA
MKQPLLEQETSSSSEATGTKSLFTDAGWFSIITFSWMGPLLDLGRKKPLDLHDVPSLDDSDSVHGVLPNFKAKIVSNSATGQFTDATAVKLAKAIVLTTWKPILVTAVYALLSSVASYVGPYLIEYFVDYLNKSSRSSREGYLLALTFVVAQLIEGLSTRHLQFRSKQVGVRARSSLVAAIYQKGLALSSQSRQSNSSGEMINVVSLDAECVGDFSRSMHDLWRLPVQIVLAMLLLYSTLGFCPAFAALLATALTIGGNKPLGRMEQNYQEKMMSAKDVRMRAMSEILQSMRILKLQGWEMIFLSKIIELRKVEMNWLKKNVYTSAMLLSIFFSAPAFVAMVTFGVCVLMGIPLETGKVLCALATFRQLQTPIHGLPDAYSMIIQTKVSLDRICSFLCLEELPSDVVTKLPRGTTDVSIEVTSGQFSWNTSSQVPTLQDVNFHIRQGMRVAVCGTVGSGKSSLLSCILGEIPKLSGEVKTCGRISYVSQTPWIQSGKIEDNILFGTEMNRERYEKVLEACSLIKDLDILPFGDQTIIGERGINLSGGQKQRIQIARALYHDADIYLFDDPFSAVDAHTGLHLFKECLLGFLASKTVVYVTHHVEFLPSADVIMVLKDGKIIQAGDYTEILNSGQEFTELIVSHKDALSTMDMLELPSSNYESSCHLNGNGSTLPIADEQTHDNNEEVLVQNGQLVQEEEREKGWVGFIVYWRYITMAHKGAFVPLILLAQIIFQSLQIGSNLWMAWAAPVSKDVNPPVNSSTMINVYVALALVTSLCVFIRSYLLVMAGCKTATMLFDKMHRCIFRAPMSFFDSTPSGRILNRASTDQSAVDTQIYDLMGYLLFPAIEILGTIILMSRVAWPVFVIFVPVIVASLSYQVCRDFHGFSYRSLSITTLTQTCVKYAPHLPLVLKGVTCTFSGGMKTGIVGRTGGGKSTLIQTLFRIVDPCIGQILIDGVDISTIGLHDLRTRLSIIPQDPVMFEGTLRSNIDPLDEYSDEQIWEALDCCHLGDEVRKNELKLDSTVTENGENWSAGQRQLVCLGRVILKRRRILVLDEATSSVDPITDSLIQKTLKQQFAECTVITIAHRITSVLDSERVILLDNGEIAENDSPAKLLEDSSSLFSKLVSEYTMGSKL